MQTDATLLASNSQHCWMLHVASICTPFCMLLRVVGSCCAKLETGQTFDTIPPNNSLVPWSPKRSATTLDAFAQLFQHCRGRIRALQMVFKILWVISFPRCPACPSGVGSCCICLHTTDAATSNMVSPTMLGVVAFVCTSLNEQLVDWLNTMMRIDEGKGRCKGKKGGPNSYSIWNAWTRLSEFLRTPNSYWIAIALHSCRLETRWRVFVIGKWSVIPTSHLCLLYYLDAKSFTSPNWGVERAINEGKISKLY